jgi:hypothetical protein
MINDDALHALVYKAISSHPPRRARLSPAASPTDTHRAEGAYRAYLDSIALFLGAHYPMGGQESPQDITAWRTLRDALDTVLSHAASTLGEPDYDDALRQVHTVAEAHGLTPRRRTPQPPSMQERILTALTDLGDRTGCQVTIQRQFANTGRLYYTAGTGFTVLVELAYHFDTDSCALHYQGPAIEALHLRDSPPSFRYEHGPTGRQLNFHALRYTDGERITTMLDLLARALATATGPS